MGERFALRNKVGLVTGAGGGIGAALAVQLARAGCTLALVDKNAAGLAATVAAVEAAGGRASTHVVDLADEAAIMALPDAVAAAHGTLDLLINNAGVALGGTFDDTTLTDFDWVVAINFQAVVRMTHAFLPMLHASPMAQIVNVSSLYGIIAPPGQTAYSASKFAVRGFSEALRHEFIGTPIGVTVVHPGGVATGIARNARLSAKIDPATAAKGRAHMETLLRLSPDKAAATIIAGIERRAWRVIVGTDAKIVTWLQRLMPVRYWTLIARLEGASGRSS
jgi:short-subunit dehydrogenase